MRSTSLCRRPPLAVIGCLAAATATPLAAAAVRIDAVTVDGRTLELHESARVGTAHADREQPIVRVPADGKRLEIRYSGTAPDDAATESTDLARATRLRHRLDGADDAWRDSPASGRVFLQFHDAAGNVIDTAETAVSGESPGWTGGLARSPYHAYRLKAVAPASAVRVTAHFLSHGAEQGRQVVGQIGIDEVEIRVTPAAGGQPARHPLAVRGVPPSDDVLDTPDGWARRGSWGRMAQIRAVGPPSGRPILAIIDDDPDQFGNWSSTGHVAVGAGDIVELSWRSAHSLGLGGSVVVTYRDLPPGRYWFRAGSFRPAGEPTGDETSLGIELVVPWHARPEVWLAVLLVGVGLTAVIGRSLALARIKRRLEEVERAHALERERTRIARDLHDEVGAALTEIAMQQYWVQREMEETAPPATLARVERSRQAVVDLVRNVDAIVWAVNPANDTLDRFVPYLTHSIEQFLEHAGVVARIDAPDDPPPLPLEGGLRHSLFLAVREAVNNAVRHGQPTTVWLTVQVRSGPGPARLAITVEDDGRGINAAATEATGGLGVESMRRRVEDAGGSFALLDRPGGGTRVSLEVPLSGSGS
jgi:signal transduction histidine kinase